MALINRLSRLFKADLHAVLERIEEPATLLKQSLREMEDALSRDRHQSKRLQHEHSEILTREEELVGSLCQLDAELATCFECERDDLARAQVRRKLEMQRQQMFLGRRRDVLEKALLRLQRRIEENANRLQSMRQKAELLSSDDQAPSAHFDVRSSTFTAELSVSEEEVEVAFLREKQRRNQC